MTGVLNPPARSNVVLPCSCRPSVSRCPTAEALYADLAQAESLARPQVSPGTVRESLALHFRTGFEERRRA